MLGRVMTHATLVPVLAAVLLLQACGWGGVKAHRNETLPAEHIAGGSVLVLTRNGKVKVLAAPDLDEVVIETRITCTGSTYEMANARLDETYVSVARRTDRTLEIRPVFPEPIRGGDGANITIKVPDADGVEVHTSNGSIVVDGLSGPLRADTSNGAVHVRDHDGPAHVTTSNGGVNVSGQVGELVVGTSNGNVEAAGVSGSAKIRTSNGSVRLALEGGDAGPVDVRSSNGAINVSLGPGFAGRLACDTSNGSVKVTDHAGRVTTLDLGRSSGTVVVGHGDEPSRLDTSNGSIRVVVAGS